MPRCEFWSALHGFVLLEMTGVMDDIDTDAVFTDMVLTTGRRHGRQLDVAASDLG